MNDTIKKYMQYMKARVREYSEWLVITTEHSLTHEALIMDMLIVKKDPNIEITKNIGRIFRTHNIVEYKSEKDSLSISDYNKVLAYALLYSSFEKAPLADVTVTFSLTMRPRKLLKNLEHERGLGLVNAGNGITYIMGEILPVQIIESMKLPDDENLFMKNLRSGFSAEEITEILKKYDELFVLDTKNVYIDRLIKANKDACKEAIMMSEELRRIWDEIADETGWLADRDQKVIANAIRETARTTAKKMLHYGDPIDKIAAVTELPFEEVMELASTQVLAQ